MGTGFAVAEECGRYTECGDYMFAYGQHVLMIEYREQDFASVCAAFMITHTVVPDLDLVTPDATATSTRAADARDRDRMLDALRVLLRPR